MTLILRNIQRVVPLRRAPLRFNLEIARSCLRVKCFDVGVICTSNARIRQINRDYRGHDSATDVLSFPFHEGLDPSFLPVPTSPDEYNLGDIYLGVEFIYQQCNETQEDYNSILTVTAVHGLCHLLGHKHSSAEDWKRKKRKKLPAAVMSTEEDVTSKTDLKMFEKENEILMEINRLTGSSLKPLSTGHF